MPEPIDVAIIGGGAAGLMAGIWAGRTNSKRSIVIFDGAEKLGAKILVAGGGRCNVTHHKVSSDDYAGSDRPSIAKVLDRFPVSETQHFFKKLGVELKQEKTGKLFPISDRAKTVLNVLINETKRRHVELRHPQRVTQITQVAEGFDITTGTEEEGNLTTVLAKKVIVATGGQSLPKTGSDGFGFELMRALGHSITPHLFPALVPLRLPREYFITELKGLTLPTRVMVKTAQGKTLASFTDSTLCTHFGMSGPSIMDISRYFTAARLEDETIKFVINWLPQFSPKQLEKQLIERGRKIVLNFLKPLLTERLALALAYEADVNARIPGHQLSAEDRAKLIQTLTHFVLPITGDRGYNFAEATAGGVPLAEMHLDTMESKVCPGLYVCGEVCDVDGRIGGFNFQWAWASGFVAGSSV